MPAADANELLASLRCECGRKWRNRWCVTLEFRGLVDHAGAACCGFGFKLFHRASDACELDVLVLAAARSPFIHGETPYWPLGASWVAAPAYSLATWWHGGRKFHVIPEDVLGKRVMHSGAPWCNQTGGEWVWCGAPLSYFEHEYFIEGELFPTRTIRMYDLEVHVPRQPWAVLTRAYGERSHYIARLDEHGGIEADLRRPEHASLLQPARVRTLSMGTRLVQRWHWLIQQWA